MTTTVDGLDAFHDLVGQQIGYSEWQTITQERVNLFADATDDHQWIHVDPERAKERPVRRAHRPRLPDPVAGPVLLQQGPRVDSMTFGVNYGANKVRFPSPVPVGAELRMGVTVASAEDVEGGVQVIFDLVLRSRTHPSRPAWPKWSTATSAERDQPVEPRAASPGRGEDGPRPLHVRRHRAPLRPGQPADDVRPRPVVAARHHRRARPARRARSCSMWPAAPATSPAWPDAGATG